MPSRYHGPDCPVQKGLGACACSAEEVLRAALGAGPDELILAAARRVADERDAARGGVEAMQEVVAATRVIFKPGHGLIWSFGVKEVRETLIRLDEASASERPGAIPLEVGKREDERDRNGCAFAGPGRGDCENSIGLPGRSVPGQHDGPDDTVDEYGKPNGWCWFCWHSRELEDRGRKLGECERAIHKLQLPPDDFGDGPLERVLYSLRKEGELERRVEQRDESLRDLVLVLRDRDDLVRVPAQPADNHREIRDAIFRFWEEAGRVSIAREKAEDRAEGLEARVALANRALANFADRYMWVDLVGHRDYPGWPKGWIAFRRIKLSVEPCVLAEEALSNEHATRFFDKLGALEKVVEETRGGIERAHGSALRGEPIGDDLSPIRGAICELDELERRQAR